MLILSSLHPLYISSDQDDSDHATGFRAEDYFKAGSNYTSEGITSDGSIMKFNETHFSLTHLSSLLDKHGFTINRLIESKQVPEKGILLPKYLVFVCGVTS